MGAYPIGSIVLLNNTLIAQVVKSNPESKKLQLTGAVTGGIFQIIAYTFVKIVLISKEAAILSIPNVTLQTAFGIVVFMVISSTLAGFLIKFMKKEGITR